MPAGTTSLDIYRSAQVLVKRHGQDAPILRIANNRASNSGNVPTITQELHVLPLLIAALIPWLHMARGARGGRRTCQLCQ